MPTPIGHLFAGAVVYQASAKTKVMFLLFVCFFSLLPDIDFLFGFPSGDPNRYHHLFTHSFIFVALAGFTGGFIYFMVSGEKWFYSSAIFVSAGISHVLLDCLALDQRLPYGCPLLWPISNSFIISPITIFSDVKRISDSRQFFPSLLNLHNLKTVLLEITILTPLLAAFVWRNKNAQRN
ncbi:MAG: metal-dependent hydrolase [Calditrichaeota bacterium]|nr:MAG: metal-dependent hydrolase [Calditrichota bacterium]